MAGQDIAEPITTMVELTRKYTGSSVPVTEIKRAIYAAANEIEQHYIAKEGKRTADIVQGENVLTLYPEGYDTTYEGADILTGGSFDNTGGWIPVNANLSIESPGDDPGEMKIEGTASGLFTSYAYAAITVRPGQVLTVSANRPTPGTTNTWIGVGTSPGDDSLTGGKYSILGLTTDYNYGNEPFEYTEFVVPEGVTAVYYNIYITSGDLYGYIGEASLTVKRNPAVHAVNGIHYLAYNGTPLNPATEDWLDQNDYAWRELTYQGQPSHYLVDLIRDDGGDYLKVTLNRSPAESLNDGFSYVLTCKSRIGGDGYDVGDHILSWYRKYGEILEFGAAGRLLMQPNRKWSNPSLGKYYLAQWNKFKHEFVAQHRRSNTPGASLTARQRKWV